MRWAGRLVATFYLAFFLFFLLAQVFGREPDEPKPLTSVEVGMFIAIGVSQIGVLLCWWKSQLGAYVMLTGWVGLIALQWFLIFNPFFGLPAVAGVLLIVAARRERISAGAAAAAKGCPQ